MGHSPYRVQEVGKVEKKKLSSYWGSKQDQSRSPNEVPPWPCVALIGDIRKSKRLQHRQIAQVRLVETLEYLNTTYSDAMLSEFVITTGDEFQGLIWDATILPNVFWDIESHFTVATVRLGVGYGVLSTALKSVAIGMDGPVWHSAREAIVRAEKQRLLGGVFQGFGLKDDLILNGMARMLHFHRTRLTTKQREVLACIRQGQHQIDIADKWGIGKASVNELARKAGWVAYLEGETAWRTALENFAFSADEAAK